MKIAGQDEDSKKAQEIIKESVRLHYDIFIQLS